MSITQLKNYLLAVIALVAGYLWFADDRSQPAQAAPAKSNEQLQAETRATYLKRLRVEERREIAPGQTLTVLLVPDSKMPGLQILDKRCVIYEHAEFRTVKMLCDGVDIGDSTDTPGLESEPLY